MQILHRRAARGLLPLGLAAGLLLAGTTLGLRADDGKPIKEGDHAPDVELPAVLAEKALPDKPDAKTIHLKDFEGKKNVVLYFYPKALTGG